MSNTEQKKNPASKRKLRKLREEGNVANAQSFTRNISLSAVLVLLLATHLIIWEKMKANIIIVMDIFQYPFDEALDVASNSFGVILLLLMAPIVATILSIAVLSTMIFNNGIVFAIKPVLPNLQRVSVSSGFMRIYGRRGWIEFFAAAGRLLLWFVFLAIVLVMLYPMVLARYDCQLLCQGGLIRRITLLMIVGAIVLLLLFSGLESLLQKRLFLHDQRMTDSELKREQKDQSMSNEVRKERNRLQNEARRSGASGVALANICYFSDDVAVGVIFQPPDEQIPRVVAKAKGDSKARALRAELNKNGCIEVEHERLALLGAGCDLGAPLPASALQLFSDSLTG